MISPWKAALLILVETIALIAVRPPCATNSDHTVRPFVSALSDAPSRPALSPTLSLSRIRVQAILWYFRQPSLYLRTVTSADPISTVTNVPSVPSESASGLAHPWLATPRARGAILVDRHLHKNGGSTMRTILQANERAGVCQYWGYWQTWHGWTNFTDELERRILMRPPASALPSSLPWVCVEVRSTCARLRSAPRPPLR